MRSIYDWRRCRFSVCLLLAYEKLFNMKIEKYVQTCAISLECWWARALCRWKKWINLVRICISRWPWNLIAATARVQSLATTKSWTPLGSSSRGWAAKNHFKHVLWPVKRSRKKIKCRHFTTWDMAKRETTTTEMKSELLLPLLRLKGSSPEKWTKIKFLIM